MSLRGRLSLLRGARRRKWLWRQTGSVGDIEGVGIGAMNIRHLKRAEIPLSATPSENTVNYFPRLGCILASEIDPKLFALEPEDIHLEFRIS